MKKIQDIFFDLDHTLWDFEKNSKNALTQIYHKHNLEQYFEHFIQFHQTYKHVNSDLWVKYGKKKISKEELRDQRFLLTLEKNRIFDKTLAANLSDDYLYLSPRHTELFPTTKETLEALKNRNYRLHIITNGFVEVQYIKLKESCIINYFDEIICSEHIGYNKPDKRIFIHALEKAKAKNETSLMVGDDLKIDVLGANQVGMEAILFDPHDEHKTQAFRKIKILNQLLNLT